MSHGSSPNWYDTPTLTASNDSLQPYLPDAPNSTVSPLLESINGTAHRGRQVKVIELINTVSEALSRLRNDNPTAQAYTMRVDDAIRVGTGVIQRINRPWFNSGKQILPGNHRPGEGQAPSTRLCRASHLYEKALNRCRLAQYELVDRTSGHDRLAIAVPIAIACLSLVNAQQAWSDSTHDN